jgi:hypothetical protein
LAAVLRARREAGRTGTGGEGADAALLAELGLTRAALQSYLDEHGEELKKTIEWIGV